MEANKTEKKPKSVFQKVMDVIMTVVVVLVVIIAALVLILTITSKRSTDGAINVFGYEFRTILTGSMERCTHDDPNEECTHINPNDYEIGSLPVGTMIFVESVPEDKAEAQNWYTNNVKEGDVLTFMYQGEVITHRVIEKVTLPSGAYEIHLMGDNRGSDGVAAEQIIITEEGRRDYIIGKVTGQSEFLGWIATTIKTPFGVILMIFIPCTVIVIVELIRIIGMVIADKKAKAKEKQEQIEKETQATKSDIEELKRQIEQAKLELQKTAPVDAIEKNPDKDGE